METRTFKFQFTQKVCFTEAAATLGLARIAAESLYGVDRVAFEFEATLNQQERFILIMAKGQAGYDMALMFRRFARIEFGNSEVSAIDEKTPAINP